MAKIFLNANTVFTVSDNATVIGSNGSERLLISGTPDIDLDANVEAVDFSGYVSDYTFQVIGTEIQIMSGSNHVATFAGLNNPAILRFWNGSAVLTLTGVGVASLGGTALPTAATGAVEPDIINTTDVSQTADSPLPSAPALSFSTPMDNATGVDTGANIVLTFSENVTAVAEKNVVIHRISDNSLLTTIAATDAQVSIAGRVVTVNPTTDLSSDTDYYVLIDPGAFKDASNNDYAGLADMTALNFTTGTANDVATSMTKVFFNINDIFTVYNNAIVIGSTGSERLLISGTPDIDLDANVEAVDFSGYVSDYTFQVIGTEIQIMSGSNHVATLAGLNNPATLRFANGSTVLTSTGVGVASLGGTALPTAAAGHIVPYIINSTDISFTTVDFIAPTLSSTTPMDNATAVAIGTNIVLTFNETVTAVAGKNIVIHKTSDNSVVTTIAATDPQVSITGGVVTINPTNDLASSTDYYVLIDAGAFKDTSNNNYTGITGTTTLNFTTTAAAATTVITPTTAGGTFDGTAGNDTFNSTYDGDSATDTFANNNFLNGNGGTDTLNINHFANVAITPPDTLWAGITGIEKVVFNTTGDGFDTAFKAAGIELTTTTSGAGAINITMTSFTGTAAITATSIAGAQTIITGSGVSSVTATSGAGALTIYGAGLTTASATTTGAGIQTIGDAGGGGAHLVTVNAISNSGAQIITSTSTSPVTFTATSTSGMQAIITGTGADSVRATSAAGTTNTITTDAGNDTIVAGLGNDLLTGGLGSDSMTGGGGADRFAIGNNGSIIGT
ncbi:MAG: Ig-like domain-containing protein [Desulfamplus sp.]|nr:Ig-like domain-containing protein [Desulfamplus sp.]